MNGTLKHTLSGSQLKKGDLDRNKKGCIVSMKASQRAKQDYAKNVFVCWSMKTRTRSVSGEKTRWCFHT